MAIKKKYTNIFHCDFCLFVCDCNWHYETHGKPCAIFELMEIKDIRIVEGK